jgi:hypothetical protein
LSAGPDHCELLTSFEEKELVMKPCNRNHKSSASRRARSAIRTASENVFESLESRRLYTVTAIAANGVLTITGDDNANAITVSRDAGGTLRVNNGAVTIAGAVATTSNTRLISVSGAGGNDRITLDETNGALPRASLAGGAGNDTIIGGAGADVLSGGDGNDMLLGKAGNDQLFGGAGNDTLTGGTGADQAFGQSGDDRMIWNPGDGSDLKEGGDGIDTVEVNGGDVAETFTAQVSNGHRRSQRRRRRRNLHRPSIQRAGDLQSYRSRAVHHRHRHQ